MDCMSSRIVLVARNGGSVGAGGAGGAWQPADKARTTSTTITTDVRMNPHDVPHCWAATRFPPRAPPLVPRAEVRQHASAVHDREPAKKRHGADDLHRGRRVCVRVHRQ